jgi:hypothetical protein
VRHLIAREGRCDHLTQARRAWEENKTRQSPEIVRHYADALIAAQQTEIDRLEREGTPGVMHEIDKAFYDLTVKQRDQAWERESVLKAAAQTERERERAERAEAERDLAIDMYGPVDAHDETLGLLRSIIAQHTSSPEQAGEGEKG